MAWNRYPYSDFHEFNLDWVINTLKKLTSDVEDFVSLNAIKYADPIQWDITRQYEKNTVVIDPATGTAYISVAPVPIGVQLTREEYWTVVFDLGSFVVRAAKNFTPNYEAETTTTATITLDAGDLVVWGDTLYVANVNITPGDSYVPDGNIKRVTEEDITGRLIDLTTTDKSNLVAAVNEVFGALNDAVTMITGSIGDLDDLTTTDKSNIVAAINEVLSAVGDAITTLEGITGDLDDLTTSDKTSIVDAINELVTGLQNINTVVGDLGDLATTDQTSIVNAINELVTGLQNINTVVGNLNDLTTSDKTSIVNATNELVTGLQNINTVVGDLNDLNTTDKSSIVNAINEVLDTAGTLKPFNTVADMIADANLSDGNGVITAGYASINDGGAALYHITNVLPTDYYETLNNGLYAELIPGDYVNVATFGAVGDGVTDDTLSINAALSTGKNVRFNPGLIYMIDAVSGGLQAQDDQIIDLNDATLKAIPNNSTTYGVITLNTKKNVLIKNGAVLGERSDHTGSTGEYGMCIRMYSCENITLENISLNNGWGDGVYLGDNGNNVPCKKIHISNCIIDNNRRNGISIVNVEGVIIADNIISNTYGTAPQRGIDIEPNVGNTARDVKIINNTLKDNQNGAISVYGSAISDVVISGNYMTQKTGMSGHFIRTIYCENVEVSENIIRGYGKACFDAEASTDVNIHDNNIIVESITHLLGSAADTRLRFTDNNLLRCTTCSNELILITESTKTVIEDNILQNTTISSSAGNRGVITLSADSGNTCNSNSISRNTIIDVNGSNMVVDLRGDCSSNDIAYNKALDHTWRYGARRNSNASQYNTVMLNMFGTLSVDVAGSDSTGVTGFDGTVIYNIGNGIMNT